MTQKLRMMGTEKVVPDVRAPHGRPRHWSPVVLALVLLAVSTPVLAGSRPRFGLAGPAPSQSKEAYLLFLESGARIVWWRIGWAEVYDSRTGAYDWRKFDADLDRAAQDSVAVVMKIFTGAGWDRVRGGDRFTPTMPSFPPRDVKEYREFVRRTAEHYRGKIRDWEIGNEPYGEERWGGTIPEYFELLRISAEELHQVDSLNNVSNGGLNYGPFIAYYAQKLVDQGKEDQALRLFGEFAGGEQRFPEVRDVRGLKRFLKEKKRAIDFTRVLFEKGYRDIDNLEIHAYADYHTIERLLALVNAEMKANGWSKPIRMKTGFPVDPLAEPAQAAAVVKNLVTCFAGGAEKVIWFELTDSRDRASGLVQVKQPPILSPKPSYYVFQRTVSLLEGFTSLARVKSAKDTYVFKFERPRGPTWVCWAEKGGTASISVGSPTAKVRGLSGESKVVKAKQGTISLALSSSPMFVEEE